MKRSRFFLAFALAISGFLFGTELFHAGSFFDGTIYATISRNLSEGVGDVWHLNFTATKHKVFYEHPPLVFWLQSLFFRLFGDVFFVERMYQLSVLGFTSWVMVLLSKQLTRNKDSIPFVSVVIWLVMPIVMWSFKNNMLETTLTLFSLLSVYFVLLYMKGERMLYIVLASTSLLGAFLSKGFVGLFPLAVPLIYGLVFKKVWLGFRASIAMWLCVLIFIGFVWWLSPEAVEGVMAYVNQQVLPSLQNNREVTTGHHWSISLRLLSELLIPMSVVAVLHFLGRFRKVEAKIQLSPKVWFLILVGLSASLPLMVTLKQRAFYIVPSLPFFALAFGVMVRPVISELMRKISDKYLRRVEMLFYGLTIVCFAYGIATYGTISRDEPTVTLTKKLAGVLPEQMIVSAPYKLVVNYPLVAYAARFGKISFDHVHQHHYVLRVVGGNETLTSYRAIDLDVEGYELLERIPIANSAD